MQRVLLIRQIGGEKTRNKAGIVAFIEPGNYLVEVKAIFRESNLVSVQMGVNASHKEN